MRRTVARMAPIRSASTLAASSMPGSVTPSVASSSSSSSSSFNKPRNNRFILAAAVIGAGALGAWSALRESADAAAPETGLNPKEFRPFTLAKRLHYNHNTDLFMFELADPSATLDLPVSSFVLTKFKGADGKDVIKPYTPISQHERGMLSLLVKKYPEGKMSQHIHSLKPGDKLEIKGPLPKLQYKANMKREIGMVAGGTGITPMLQVIEEALTDPTDRTTIKLLFANTSSRDILLKERIDALALRNPDRLKVTYLIDKPERDWNGPVGFVSKELLKKTMPPPCPVSLVYVCGPPPMMNLVSGPKAKDYSQGEVGGLLKELGYEKESVFKF